MDNKEGTDNMIDPYMIMKKTHETSIVMMKEQLLEALTNRKESVLPLALDIFNKLQSNDAGVNQREFGTIDAINREEQAAEFGQRESKTLNEHIDQLSALVDDHRSPIFSTIKDVFSYI